MEVDKPWLATSPLTKIHGLPDFGWRVRLDHEFKEACTPFTIPRLHQLPAVIPLSFRYMRTWYKTKKKGRKLFIDNLNLVPWRPIYGVPIGGIGSGTIGRGYRGEFCRFNMIPGMYQYNTVDADQFIVNIRRKGQTVYQQVLSSLRPQSGRLDSWNWPFDPAHAHYHGLYPRAWTCYELPGQNVVLICRQISPVFPHDYKDTSLPTAVFVWRVENYSGQTLDVSLTFCFQNGQGEKLDRASGVWSEPFTATDQKEKVSGVMIHQSFNNMKCVYGIGARHKPDSHISHKVAFNPAGSGRDLWMDLMNDGQLDSTSEPSKETKKGEELASAVCIQCTVPANQSKEAEFSLTWDMPIIHFGANEKLYARRYARWFGTDGDATPRLASYALNTYQQWEEMIDAWQSPILKNSSLPRWYKSALFNELYFISDGGTLWVDPYDEDPTVSANRLEKLHPVIQEYGRFAYLEGHEYRMYNTYDVHHYASFALIMLWPKLQLSIQYDIADSVPREQSFKVTYCMHGEHLVSKASNAVPHDIGDPDDEPWERVNAYLIHPTQEWKDLNTKFVLQVYRDFADTKDHAFLQYMYPAIKLVMVASLRWDVDDDGIIDNSGFPDQTYDAWSVVGASAYCGGMWLAAVRMFIKMATLLDHTEDIDRFSQILNKGKGNFEKKLWNGQYYNYDSSTSNHADSIMADQLAGQWFLKASGFPDDDINDSKMSDKKLPPVPKVPVLPPEATAAMEQWLAAKLEADIPRLRVEAEARNAQLLSSFAAGDQPSGVEAGIQLNPTTSATHIQPIRPPTAPVAVSARPTTPVQGSAYTADPPAQLLDPIVVSSASELPDLSDDFQTPPCLKRGRKRSADVSPERSVSKPLKIRRSPRRLQDKAAVALLPGVMEQYRAPRPVPATSASRWPRFTQAARPIPAIPVIGAHLAPVSPASSTATTPSPRGGRRPVPRWLPAEPSDNVGRGVNWTNAELMALYTGLKLYKDSIWETQVPADPDLLASDVNQQFSKKYNAEREARRCRAYLETTDMVNRVGSHMCRPSQVYYKKVDHKSVVLKRRWAVQAPYAASGAAGGRPIRPLSEIDLHALEFYDHEITGGVDSKRRVPGKMEAYLAKSNPAHLKLLVDAHVISDIREDSEDTKRESDTSL